MLTGHQHGLKKDLGNSRIVNKFQWPPQSELNPLDYYFWNEVKSKVYEGRGELFRTLVEQRERIEEVWETAVDLPTIRKAISQFCKRLYAVWKQDGGPIKYLLK